MTAGHHSRQTDVVEKGAMEPTMTDRLSAELRSAADAPQV
jgi:hypothetical protein